MNNIVDWQWYQNPRTGYWYRIQPEDWLLSNRIGQDGGRGYQVQCQDWVRNYFNGRPARCALDIGANMGITAIEYAHCFDIVHAFEPVPDVFDQLLMVVDRNNLKNINTHNTGISDHAGTASINYKSKNSFASYVSETGNVHITLNTIDSYCFQEVDFIKIDVEGLEPEVVAGAWQTITEQLPVIQLEYKPKFGRRSQHNIVETCRKLESIGYVLKDKKGTSWTETKLSDIFATKQKILHVT
jgi:FkbM family methyltransferase